MKPGKFVQLFLCAFLLLLHAASAPAQAPSAPAAGSEPPRMELQKLTLPNGLRLFMLEDHSTPIINLQVWYHVGSKDERAGRTGFAHMFEHLMYKGSAHVGIDEHSRIIEAVGGFDNAYTNDDVTVYWQTFPSNYLERVIWLEADRMGSLNVDETNFKSEREVVKEERRMRVDDPPYGRVFEDLYDAAFTVHPYKHTTIGSMEDLNKATLDDVREFHRAFYRPDNATMVIAGDFTPADAIRWAGKHFAGIPRPAQPVPRVTAQEPPQTAERRLSKSYSNTPLPAIIAGYKIPARYAPDAYALDLASNILSQGESSRLYRKLVYDERLAVQAAGGGNFTEHPNLFFAFAVMNQGKTAADGEKSIMAELERMKTELVSAEELEKAKNQVTASVVLGRRRIQPKGDEIGLAAVLGSDAELVNTQLARYLRVTREDIQRVAREYFVNPRRTVMVIEPPKPSN